MIRFDDWLLTKDEGPVIARQYDNLTRRLEILGDIPEGWSWTLLVQADKHLDIIALAPMEGGLGVDLTKEMLAIGGYHTLQLKGTKGELVRHTNQLHNVLIPASLSGDANWPEVPSEFSQIEANIRELGAHPPIPGDGGFWMVWDLEKKEYVTSDLPLPNVSVGPAGKAATIEVGETVTGDPGTQAAVENTGTENAAVLRFTIPRGAVGPTGATPDISVEVTGLPAGAEPTVSVSGTPEKPVISLGIPQGKQGDPGGKGDPGDPGQTPNITIGQVETLPAGSPVTASITGQTPNLVLNLGIPQGQQGASGQAATIEIAETETVSSDTPAAMVELPESTPQARRYKAQVPQGIQGPAGVGLPALSGPEDAGKTPVVNPDGTGWLLTKISGGFEWTLIASVTLDEPVRTVKVSSDDEGAIFSCDAVIIRQLTTCEKTSRQNMTVYVNGKAVFGNLSIIKNVGYYGPADISIYPINGLLFPICVYSDATTTSAEINYGLLPYNNTGVSGGVFSSNVPVVTADKISEIRLECSDSSVKFGVGSVFKIYGGKRT